MVNLLKSDQDSVKIALTGTPLLKEVAKQYDSKLIFGDYIHKYYYNSSIADGYTLRLIREAIATKYSMQMKDIIDQIKVLKGDISKSEIFAHSKFAEPMLDYILEDLYSFREYWQDDSLGGMVVCDSADQARELFKFFEKKFGKQETESVKLVAESRATYKTENRPNLKAALILHDENDKLIRKDLISAYKLGKIDILFVYNMLLTGFDAKRLKKLYLARVVKNHNLLQTLTRVNRPYKKYRYGHVVDFADITKEFKETNQNYFEELQEELGDEMQSYSNLFKTREEIETDISNVKDKLFQFDIKNAENFRLQTDEIKDKAQLVELVKLLNTARELKNIIRFQDETDLLNALDFNKLNQLLKVAQARLDTLNLVEEINSDAATSNLLNIALEDIFFQFEKVSEEEMILADKLKDQLRKTREELQRNFDQSSPEFISLREELERIFKNKNLDEVSQEDMRDNIVVLSRIYDEVKELNRKNNNLRDKYDGDEKYVRIHKRLLEKNTVSAKEAQIYDALMQTRSVVDGIFLKNINLMQNDEYFKEEVMSIVIDQFIDQQKMKLDFDTTEKINHLIVNEYLNQFNYQ